MEKNRSGTLIAAAVAVVSLTNAAADDHKTGTGITLKSVNPDGIQLSLKGEEIAIPGGAPFAMAQTEVTQAQFERMLGHNPAKTDADHLPVDRVTATEAAAFCKALTERDRAAGVLPDGKIYRLPTVREWVLAALPGGLVPAPDAVGAIAWHQNNSAGLLHPVGAKTANAYGLQDMIGNAAEWVTPDPNLKKAMAKGQSEVFSARTLVQVVRKFSAERATGSTNATFFATQREIITARLTLDAVVTTLGLDKRWDMTPAQAADKLKSKIDVRPLRGTDLIEIHAEDEEATLSARIADEVTQSYTKRLNESAKKRGDTARAELEKQVASQKEKLEASRIKMLDIMEEYNIVDLSLGKPTWMRGEQSPRAKKLRDALEGLEGLERVEAAVELAQAGSILKKRYSEYEKIRIEKRELLESGLNDKHPKVVALDSQIAQLLGIMTATIDVEISADKVARMPALQVEKDSLKERRNTIVYIESKKDYELNKELLNSMQSMLAKEKIDARAGGNQVIIHEQAVIPQTPARGARWTHPVAIGGSVFDEPNDLADPHSTDPDARTAGVGFRFVLADDE